MSGHSRASGPGSGSKPPPQATVTAEYCAQLQQWMWGYYWSYTGWQSWLSLSALSLPPPPPPGTSARTPAAGGAGGGAPWLGWNPYLPGGLLPPAPVASPHPGGAHIQHSAPPDPRAAQEHDPPQAGREYTIPSPLQRFLAETVDFFILFCVKATIVLWIMHLSGMKDITILITQFIVEEIDENTSMEDLQKMMAVALVYRVLVCFYEFVPHAGIEPPCCHVRS